VEELTIPGSYKASPFGITCKPAACRGAARREFTKTPKAKGAREAPLATAGSVCPWVRPLKKYNNSAKSCISRPPRVSPLVAAGNSAERLFATLVRSSVLLICS
jgi:hypothetical protein